MYVADIAGLVLGLELGFRVRVLQPPLVGGEYPQISRRFCIYPTGGLEAIVGFNPTQSL